MHDVCTAVEFYLLLSRNKAHTYCLPGEISFDMYGAVLVLYRYGIVYWTFFLTTVYM